MAEGGDDLNASIAHVVLCIVAGNGISRMSNRSYTHPGMHLNFVVHGVVGFLNFQSGLAGDVKQIYEISMKAARYLALPCLNADLNRNDQNMSLLHFLSGAIPFAISLSGKDNVPLGNVAIILNILSLCHYSHTYNREYGWYTAAAACVAYFVTPQANQKFVFPLGLALMDYCAYKIWHFHFDIASLPPPRR